MILKPSGTVTFLFTDIEGSTVLAQRYPDKLPALLTRHREILQGAIEAHHGYIFQVVGDSFQQRSTPPVMHWARHLMHNLAFSIRIGGMRQSRYEWESIPGLRSWQMIPIPKDLIQDMPRSR